MYVRLSRIECHVHVFDRIQIEMNMSISASICVKWEKSTFFDLFIFLSFSIAQLSFNAERVRRKRVKKMRMKQV